MNLEPGDGLEAKIEGRRLILTPVAPAPPRLSLTPSGEAKEAEADDDLRHGRIREFATAEALLRELAE